MTPRAAALAAALASLAACAAPPEGDPYFERSGRAAFPWAERDDFRTYVTFERRELAEHRVFFDASDAEAELDLVAPFERAPAAPCGDGVRRGALLVHGLSDTAYALRALGERLASSCVRVRAILLPGHGASAADLIDVERDEWLAAVRFGVRSFAGGVDELAVIGFSLGGALAAQVAAEDDAVDRAVLLSPALGVGFPMIVAQSVWLRYVRDWLDVDPYTAPIRFRSTATNAVAQAFLQSGAARAAIEGGVDKPVLLVANRDDRSVDYRVNLDAFERAFAHPDSRAILYGDDDERDDPRIEVRDVYSAAAKILNLSHVGVAYPWDDPFFGALGAHRECGQDIGLVSQEDAARCLASPFNWKGEYLSEGSEARRPLQRLTYNPDFDAMAARIVAFLGAGR